MKSKIAVALIFGAMTFSASAADFVLTSGQQKQMIEEALYQRKIALQAREDVRNYVEPKLLLPKLGATIRRWPDMPMSDYVKANDLGACATMTADVYTLAEAPLHDDWIDVAARKNRDFIEDSKACDIALADPAQAFAALKRGQYPDIVIEPLDKNAIRQLLSGQ